MDGQLGGYDVSYQLDADSVRKALQSVVVDPLAMRLTTLPLAVVLSSPAPANTMQSGAIQAASPPTVSLTMPAAVGGSVSLVVTYASMLLSLQAVPGVVGFAGVGALPPTNAGKLTITLTLGFSSMPSGDSTFVQITSTQTPDVSALGSMPDLSGLSTTIALAGPVNSAVGAAVRNAVASLLPLPIEIPLGARSAVCDIGPRKLDVTVLPKGATTQPSLAFFLTLRDGISTNLGTVTTSVLSTKNAGAIALSTDFLKTLICCLMEQGGTINGLGPHDADDCTITDHTGAERTGCCWHNKNNVQLGDKLVHVEELAISIVTGSPSTIFFHVHATQSGDGWTAHAVVEVNIGLHANQGSISAKADEVEPYTHTWTDIEWWVWAISLVFAAIGAIVGLILGGVAVVPIGAGALAGFGLGLAVSGVLDLLLTGIGDVAANAIGDALSTLGLTGMTILPPELTDKFGSITDVLEVEFDDLVVGGDVRGPRRDNVVSEGTNVVLQLGDRIDLDHGVVARLPTTPAGFPLEADLIWRREPFVIGGLSGVNTAVAARFAPDALTAPPLVFVPDSPPPSLGTLAPLGGARVLAVARSFWALSEHDLEGIAFPVHRGNAIAGSNIVVSPDPYPFGSTVFVVRTTAGRLAKCVVWRDTQDRLHLSYVTYDTWQPVAVAARWTTTLGPLVGSTAIGPRYQVSRTGTFVASQTGPNPLIWFPPTAYRWFWNNELLQGSGTLPDGTTTYAIIDKTCRMTTAMGTTLAGVLQLERGDGENAVVATLQISEIGTEVQPDLPDSQAFTAMVAVSQPPPPPPPHHRPLHEQLVDAFARGMGLPVAEVRFR